MSMTISEYGLSLLSEFEGSPRLRARECEGGRYEVSYGVTFDIDGSAIEKDRTITYVEHLAIFKNALRVFEKVVHQSVTAELNQFQFDALVALVWNIGPDAFANSTVLRHVNDRRWEDAAEAFGMWIYATNDNDNRGRPYLSPDKTRRVPYTRAMRGLLRRQYATACLFLGHPWGEACANERIELTAEKEWMEAAGKYKDNPIYRTPWHEVLALASQTRLDPPVHLGADNPARPPMEATKKQEPVKVAKAPPPKPKKRIQSKTYWGVAFMVAGSPEVQMIAGRLMNTQLDGMLGGAMQIVGVALTAIGLRTASQPVKGFK